MLHGKGQHQKYEFDILLEFLPIFFIIQIRSIACILHDVHVKEQIFVTVGDYFSTEF